MIFGRNVSAFDIIMSALPEVDTSVQSKDQAILTFAEFARQYPLDASQMILQNIFLDPYTTPDC